MLNLNKTEKLFLKGLLIFILFWYGAYFQLIPIYLFHLDINNLSKSTEVLLSMFSSLVLAGILGFIYRKDLKKEFKSFRKNIMDYLDQGFHYYGIGLIVMVVSNIIITFFLKGGGANNEQEIQKMIQSLPIIMIIEAGIIAPFNEEIVFRKTLKDVFNNPALFAFFSFLLFGGAHVISSATTILDYLYIIPYGALGAAFAFAYSKTNTIYTSMTIHMIHNTVLILLSIMI